MSQQSLFSRLCFLVCSFGIFCVMKDGPNNELMVHCLLAPVFDRCVWSVFVQLEMLQMFMDCGKKVEEVNTL